MAFTKQPMTFCVVGCKSQRPPSRAHPQWHYVIHLAFDPAEHILTVLYSLWNMVPRLRTSFSWSPSFRASPVGPWILSSSALQMSSIWRWHPKHLFFWFCLCLFILSYVYASWSYQGQFGKERGNISSSRKSILKLQEILETEAVLWFLSLHCHWPHRLSVSQLLLLPQQLSFSLKGFPPTDILEKHRNFFIFML